MSRPSHHPARVAAAALLGLALAACLPAAHAQSTAPISGELRAHRDARRLNDQGPMAQADALAPGLVTLPPQTTTVEAELRGTLRLPGSLPGAPTLTANVLTAARQGEPGGTHLRSRSNELYAAADLGAWQLTAGKKLVGWDVGYAFRPNDVVQQEVRRTLLATTQEGRPLLQVEHFDAETSTALVWVNPHRLGDADDAQRLAREGAVAARWYRRAGAADWHVIGRLGQHTGASAGAAVAWVATDALELHASARMLQRHDAWGIASTAGTGPVPANPWAVTTQGGTSQWLLGANWTGEAQQGLLVEYWHDGTAMPSSAWDDWRTRSATLAALARTPGLPSAALPGIAGNLAWQASPFDAPSLHRDNLFVRLSWQPERWLLSLDALFTPADRGRTLTAGVQWQGDRVKLNAAWRWTGGTDDALLHQLPQRQVGVLAATWAF